MARIPVVKLIGPLMKQASKMVRDPKQVDRMLNAAREKLRDRENTVSTMKTELLSLVRFVQKTVSRDYKLASASAVTLAVVGLIYLLNPIDFIPDMLPTGLIDDFAVLAYVLRTIKTELDRFKLWEKGCVAGRSEGEGATSIDAAHQENSAPSE